MNDTTQPTLSQALSKVPEITLAFWAIKILATTIGEIGGDAVTMSWLGETTPTASAVAWHPGYLIGTTIFGVIFALALTLQIRATRFNPWLYWFAILASTTVGTTLADFADRSIGLGYPGGTLLLLSLLIGSLLVWYQSMGTVAVSSVNEPKSELFYWLTITFSQTLGTALGDWVADAPSIGYVGGIAIFGGALTIVGLLALSRRVDRTVLFWAAFVLTRPLGAVVGDFLDKPMIKGGLALSRYSSTALLLVAVLILIAVLPQRPAQATHLSKNWRKR